MHKWYWFFSYWLLFAPIYAQKNVENKSSASDKSPVSSCYTVAEIQIVGNNYTKERYILQEMSLHKDSTYCSKQWQEWLDKNEKLLYATNLFHTVQATWEVLPKKRVKIVMTLKERWFLYPLVHFEIEDYSYRYWWNNLNRDLNYISYGIGLYHINFTGLGDRLNVYFNFGNEPAVELFYKIPYKQKRSGALIGYTFSSIYRRLRTVVARNKSNRPQVLQAMDAFYGTFTTNTFAVNYRPKVGIRHKFISGFQYVGISDTLHRLNPEFVQSAAQGSGKRRRNVVVSYELRLGDRIYHRYPLDSQQFWLHLTRYGTGIFSEINLSRIRLRYVKYIDVGRNWYISTLWHGAVSIPFEQAFYNAESLHFYQRLRGYDNYFIQGPLLFRGNIIAKKQVFNWNLGLKNSKNKLLQQFAHFPLVGYVYAYANMGYARSYPYQQELFLNDTLLYGGGLGVDILTFYDILIGGFYAFTRHGRNYGFSLSVGGGN